MMAGNSPLIPTTSEFQMLKRLLAGFVLSLLMVSSLPAEDTKPADGKAFDKLVVDTLRDVHNKGADLYNESKDFVGAYRMYQGALLTVRPLLAHQPNIQKAIDKGIADAEKETNPALRAFKLHETIESVRVQLKGGAAPKPDEPKKTDKKPEKPVTKPDDLKPTKPDDVKKPEKSPTKYEVAPAPHEKKTN
jgi:hypothetical protein